MEYSLCGTALRLVCAPLSRNACVAGILESLFSLLPAGKPHPDRGIELLIHESPEDNLSLEAAGKVAGEVVFDAPGLSAIRTAHGYHLRSRGSFLAVDLRSGQAAGSLSDSFMEAAPEDQRGLFFFALLLLFAARGLFALHAGGVSWQGSGFLLVGGSGCGKTTLTCALVRTGWQYLSDDAVLLKQAPAGVEALAFGRPFHCAPAMFRHFPELTLSAGQRAYGKHLVDVAPLYPGRFRRALRPQVILFPEIAGTASSHLIPLDGTATLLRLLGQGTGLLHNRDSVSAQMAILGDLASSARGYRLLHGPDVHQHPSRVSALLQRLTNPVEGDRIDAMYSAA